MPLVPVGDHLGEVVAVAPERVGVQVALPVARAVVAQDRQRLAGGSSGFGADCQAAAAEKTPRATRPSRTERSLAGMHDLRLPSTKYQVQSTTEARGSLFSSFVLGPWYFNDRRRRPRGLRRHALPQRGRHPRDLHRARPSGRFERARHRAARSSSPTTAAPTARRTSPPRLAAPRRPRRRQGLRQRPDGRHRRRPRQVRHHGRRRRQLRLPRDPQVRRASSARATTSSRAAGCRPAAGPVMPGAMPLLHRWLGNPLFSLLARRMFWVADPRRLLRPARLHARSSTSGSTSAARAWSSPRR